jgi:hypothetical protein
MSYPYVDVIVCCVSKDLLRVITINIIENVWRTIKIKLEHRLHEIKNHQDLIRIVKEIWTSIESETIKKSCTDQFLQDYKL